MHIMGVWCDMAPQGAPLELYKTKHCWVEIKTDSEFLAQSDLGDTFCRAYFVIWQKRSQLRWQISPDWPSFGLSVHLQSTLQYMTSRPSAPQCQIVVSLCVTWASQPCVLGSPACQITGLCLQHCPAHPQLFIQHILSWLSPCVSLFVTGLLYFNLDLFKDRSHQDFKASL